MVRKTKFFRILTMVLVMTLLAAMMFTTVSCGQKTNVDLDEINNEETEFQGKHTFKFEVIFLDGTSLSYDIETTQKTVGEALIEKNLISGEQGQYGLYVKTVCGATYDYDTDKAYWAFYINDEMALSGVDSTFIEDGAKYSFKVEK